MGILGDTDLGIDHHISRQHKVRTVEADSGIDVEAVVEAVVAWNTFVHSFVTHLCKTHFERTQLGKLGRIVVEAVPVV